MIMEFTELVEHVSRITGLTPIQATRLITMNLYLIGGENLIIAAIDPHVAADLADQMIEIARASMGDHLDLMMR